MPIFKCLYEYLTNLLYLPMSRCMCSLYVEATLIYLDILVDEMDEELGKNCWIPSFHSCLWCLWSFMVKYLHRIWTTFPWSRRMIFWVIFDLIFWPYLTRVTLWISFLIILVHRFMLTLIWSFPAKSLWSMRKDDLL